jgi:TolB-like protein
MSDSSRAVFLSYASQDADAARSIADALRTADVEVWMDESELVGGDAWDAKIRRQIAECALFVPVISANTQARLEGYFRIEWKLAAQRTHAMAEAKPFLLPIVIDTTRDAEAHVPGEFRAVQWTRLKDGETSAAFCARVKTLLGIGAGGPVSDPPSDSSPRERSGQRPALPQKSRTPIWIWVTAVVALLAALALWQPWKSKAPPASTPSPVSQLPSSPDRPSVADAKSIAVLPFANMSADKENTEYFSDGITEEILNALDRIPTLRVTPRTSSFSFKGRNVALDEIGRALRVASVIEGSVRKDGNKVKITVKLLNAADGSRVWAEDFDRQMTDIFALQSEIAAKVAQKLSGTPTTSSASPATPLGAQTKNLAAYDLYLRGRAAQLAWSISTQAVTLFEDAVKKDPDYALAWARLAQALVRLQQTSVGRTGENVGRARDAAARAMQLSPNLPEAHLALAAVENDHAAVQRELDIVERLRPGDAELLAARASLEYVRGNWGPEFTRLVLRAVERDPQNQGIQSLFGRSLSNAGWFSDAAQLLERSGVTWRDDGLQIRRAWVIIQNTLRWTGDVPAALSILETTPPDQQNALFFSLRAGLHAQAGNLAAALADCEALGAEVRLPTGGMAHRHPQTYSLALIELKLGRTARAAELFANTLSQAEAMEADPIRFYKVIPALVKARQGQQAEAIAVLENVIHPGADSPSALMRAFHLQTKAETLAVLGRLDEAVATLRTVHDMGYGFGYTLRLDLEWEPLRGDAKFQQLMKEAEARADAQPPPKRNN